MRLEGEAMMGVFFLFVGVVVVGCGLFVGPVTAAAVILDPARPIEGLADSKLLTEQRREALEIEIKEKALAWAVAHAEVEEIDTRNILWASMLAMKRAVLALHTVPLLALVDGDRCPAELPCRAEAIVKGDETVPAISAASILAKVARERELVRLDAHYPGYGFAQHKGYTTRAHVTALERLGATPIHRRSFEPVRRVLKPA